MNANSIVQELWRLCTILRKDGITYQQYVTELTYLLFLKMMEEQGREGGAIPAGYRWEDLTKADGLKQLQLYRKILTDLGNPELRIDAADAVVEKEKGKPLPADARALPRTVQAIFQNASTFVREPANLKRLISEIDKLHWFSSERDQFGDLYEGLLQKNAEETKRGAGQYFTPRVLIEAIVALMKPKTGEIIQDPAAGTGGFLIAADQYLKRETDGYYKLTEKEQTKQIREVFQGMENVPGTYRLLLMNLYLHGIEPEKLELGDTLSDMGAGMKPADLILTNPPFGPAGGAPTREDLTHTRTVSSYQLPFVEHCIRKLKKGGRAAIVIPDNVLFEGGRGRDLRRYMMTHCRVHTLLRLPTGIFYAQGVKTNVLFLQRMTTDRDTPKTDHTDQLAVFDLRTNMPAFGKTNPLTAEHIKDFVKAYGEDPNGLKQAKVGGFDDRWRIFTREEIKANDDSLDLTWLRETEAAPEDGLTEPGDIADALLTHLRAATAEIEALQAELGEEV